MVKDYTKQMYETVNELIKFAGNTQKEPTQSKGLLNRSSRGQEVNKESVDEPILKVVEYVKQFRKMREEINNGK